MKRILLVEDNQRLGELIVQGLQSRDYLCDLAMTLANADLLMKNHIFDALILDLGLPDGDGLDWLRKYQLIGAPPALILTARGALEDRVSGLDAGADDYMIKPFALDELAARLRALLRRPGRRAHPVLQVGDIQFDTQRREVVVNQLRLELTKKEADLLELLMRHASHVVRRSSIESALYAMGEAITPNAVEANISRLRRKLSEAGVVDVLHTVRGVGYLLKDAG